MLVVLWMGIYPKPFLDVFALSAESLATRYKTAQQALQAPERGAIQVVVTEQVKK